MVLRPRAAWYAPVQALGGGSSLPSQTHKLGLGLPGPKVVVVVAAAAGWGRLGLRVWQQAGRQERGGPG